jgi:hypothetical protein
VLFGGREGLEGAQVSAPASLRILLPGVEPVPARFELTDHWDPLRGGEVAAHRAESPHSKAGRNHERDPGKPYGYVESIHLDWPAQDGTSQLRESDDGKQDSRNELVTAHILDPPFTCVLDVHDGAANE